MQRRHLRAAAPQLVFVALTAAAAGAGLRAGLALPAPVYEQLGSRAFPIAVGLIALGLSGLKLASLAVTRAPDGEGPLVAARVLLSFALVVAYAAALDVEVVHFIASTAVFLLLFVWLLRPRTGPAGLALGLVVALAFSAGVFGLFTRVFYLDI